MTMPVPPSTPPPPPGSPQSGIGEGEGREPARRETLPPAPSGQQEVVKLTDAQKIEALLGLGDPRDREAAARAAGQAIPTDKADSETFAQLAAHDFPPMKDYVQRTFEELPVEVRTWEHAIYAIVPQLINPEARKAFQSEHGIDTTSQDYQDALAKAQGQLGKEKPGFSADDPKFKQAAEAMATAEFWLQKHKQRGQAAGPEAVQEMTLQAQLDKAITEIGKNPEAAKTALEATTQAARELRIAQMSTEDFKKLLDSYGDDVPAYVIAERDAREGGEPNIKNIQAKETILEAKITALAKDNPELAQFIKLLRVPELHPTLARNIEKQLSEKASIKAAGDEGKAEALNLLLELFKLLFVQIGFTGASTVVSGGAQGGRAA